MIENVTFEEKRSLQSSTSLHKELLAELKSTSSYFVATSIGFVQETPTVMVMVKLTQLTRMTATMYKMMTMAATEIRMKMRTLMEMTSCMKVLYLNLYCLYFKQAE